MVSGIPRLEGGENVRAAIGVEQRRTGGQRRLHGGDRWEVVDPELDLVDAVLGLVSIRGDHDTDRLPHVPEMPVDDGRVALVLVPDDPQHREPAVAAPLDGGRTDEVDAGG